MPDIGLLEMVVIGLIMFLVIGPERMPELFGQVADFVRKTRKWVTDAKEVLRDQAQELKDPLLQAKEVVRGEVETATEDVTGDLHKELKELKETGEVMKQRPLSEIYTDMQEKEKEADDDHSKGFMQGYERSEPENQNPDEDNKA